MNPGFFTPPTAWSVHGFVVAPAGNKGKVKNSFRLFGNVFLASPSCRPVIAAFQLAGIQRPTRQSGSGPIGHPIFGVVFLD
jgi:hypothetical protein